MISLLFLGLEFLFIHGYVSFVLTSKLFTIKRLSSEISSDRLKRVADSLYTSKARYGLQLFGKVRINDEDSTNVLLNSLQNKYARFLSGKKLTDKITTKKILSDLKIISINQMSAQIKLTEVWKSRNSSVPP